MFAKKPASNALASAGASTLSQPFKMVIKVTDGPITMQLGSSSVARAGVGIDAIDRMRPRNPDCACVNGELTLRAGPFLPTAECDPLR